MGEYIKREDALKIIDSYSKACTEEGKVVSDAIRDIIAVITPTADVVPKSEYDDLQSMLDATIAGQETLQKALAEAKSNNEIRGESFYFELEKFEERGKQLEREHDAEVARGMIEFIKEKIKELEDHTPTKELDQAIDLVNWILENVINDLEKKYTEGTANDRH